MTTNPMAKKARNSFLLGVIITLIIAILAGAALYFFVLKDKAIASGDEKIAYVFTLKQDVKRGDEITANMVEAITVNSKAAPSDFIPSKTKKDDKSKTVDQSWIPGRKAKLDLKAGTVLSNTVTYNEEVNKDVRLVEYNMLTLPTTLTIGDTVDIRLILGNGTDFIVVSKKIVENIVGNTVTFNLSEKEILLMDSAIVEAYLSNTANLYVLQYVDAVLQDEATGTYVPNEDVKNLITDNPNIVSTAKNKFSTESRSLIIDGLSDASETNLETGIKTQLENAKKAREAYLNGLTTY